MKKRLCSMLLCAALILSSGGLTAKAAAATAPKMTVEVNQVTGGTTVEVSLIVESTTDIQSAHAVLMYDATKLVLTQWDGTKIQPGTVPAAGGTMAPGNVAGKPSLVFKEAVGNWAYLYLGAAGQQAYIEAGKQVVTVQFQYGTGGTPEDLLSDRASYLKLADQVPSELAMMTDPAALNAGGVRYTTASADTKLETAFTLESKQSLYGGGQPGATGDHAITFFDWDGRVVDVAAVGPDATAQATAAQGKLSNKLGYAFDRWLLVEQQKSGLETKHGTLPANKTALPQENQDLASFTDITGNLLVMAAYCTTAEVNNGQGADADLTNAKTYYTIGTPVYNQFTPATTSTGDYSITCTVERGSALRAKQPAVKAMVFMKSGEFITLKIDLENTDSTEFQLVVPRLVDKVYCTFVDTGGLTAWVSAGDRSGLSQSASADIIREGAGTLIAQTAWEVANGKITGWDKVPAANSQALSDAGWTTAQRDKLVTLSEGREKAFTYQEAVTALKNG